MRDALLFPAREQPDRHVRELPRIDRVEDGLDPAASCRAGPADAPAVPVKTLPHDITGPQWGQGVDATLLRHVSDGVAPPARRPPGHPQGSGAQRLQAQDDSQQAGLARPIGAKHGQKLTVLHRQGEI